MTAARVIREIPRNSRGVIRIDLETFKGHLLVGVREWARNPETGELVATPRGVSLPIALLPELARAIVEAERVARDELRWLDADPDDERRT